MNTRTHSYERKKRFENKAVSSRQNNVTRRLLATLMLLVVCSLSYGQTSNKKWKEDLNSTLEEFQSCATSKSDKAPCSSFIAESINVVYPLNGVYLDASASAVPLLMSSHKQNAQWTILGKAYEQDALARAQDLANDQRAVIAVYQLPGGDVLHMALILPGNLSFSGSWGFSVPNSASFFLATPEKSFVGKGLSYSFAKSMIKDVTLFVRN